MLENGRTMTIDLTMVRGLLVAGALVGAAACGDAQADGAVESGDESGSFVRVINVEIAPVAPIDWVEMIRITGTAQAHRDVTIAAEESGAIVELLVDKGRAVRRGQAIARIDDRLLKAQVAEADAQASLAGETWERRRRLWEDDGMGSELAYLEARYGAEQAEARLESLQRRLDRTVIRAPFGGVLDGRFVELGSMVSPGSPVARIVDLDPVKVTGGVPERYAADVRPGAAGTVAFDVLEDQIFEGTLTYVGAAVDARNRTFPVEFELPNPGGVIKPEMVANISVVRRAIEQAIVVSQDALVRVEQGYMAFVLSETTGDPTVESRIVVTGPSQGNEVVILEGLEEGDRLVVLGQKQLASGDRVRVVGGG